MQYLHDKRRKEPSYTVPFLYEGLEVLLIVIVFGILEGTLNIREWSFVSLSLGTVWFLYTLYKLSKVLSRQTPHKRR